MRYFGAVVLLLMGVAVAACSNQPPLEPDVGQDLTTLTPLGSITGVVGPGAEYEIVVPPLWNGDLVLYAHGYVDPAGGPPLTPAEQALLPVLPAMGYAVAWSTYSEDGLAVKDGAQRTKQLRGIFADAVDEPDRTYLIGGSLGGLVALALTERFPQHYDGTLALCGMVGGSQAQIDYVGHVRVLFDAFYPGTLPGGLFDSPSLTPGQVEAIVVAAVLGDPLPAAMLGNVMGVTFGTPIPGASEPELVASLVTALTFDVRGFADVLARTHGHVPFDNSGVTYVGTGSPMADAWLNASVARYEAKPDARRYLDRHHGPSGELDIPILTLHNPMDPVVPAFHEALLQAYATGAGHGANLAQWSSSVPYGHCDFSVDELTGAFGALVAWAEYGVPPTMP